MQKDKVKKLETLMKKSLDINYHPKKRADLFNELFNEYIVIDKKCDKWNEFRIKLRKKLANPLTNYQRKEYGITRNDLKNSYFEIKNNISKSQKSSFPVEIFYEISFATIKKISLKQDKILDIGYGDFPILITLLNNKGYDAYGIEPFPKQFDGQKTFKCKINNIPKKLEKLRFNIILANMVYSVNYTSHFPKKFKWELGNKNKIIKKLFKLLEDNGFLILIDDIGTIFAKKDIKKYFQIIHFEKDIEVINFDTNKIEDFGRITILKKK